MTVLGRRRMVRRSLAIAAWIALALLVAGCGIVDREVVGQPPIAPGPLGPIFPAPDGGPPIECRGVPKDECIGFTSRGETNIVRFIVVCMSVCSPEKGDVAMYALRPSGAVDGIGQGSYSGGVAVPQPPITPEPSLEPEPSPV
jgi:hypothetical protein